MVNKTVCVLPTTDANKSKQVVGINDSSSFLHKNHYET